MSYTIEVRGLDAIQRKLQMPLGMVLKPAFFAIGQDVRSRIAVYPGAVKYPIEWASEKQRRWYFATHKDALPYVRGVTQGSQRLGTKWAVDMESLRLGVIVGTEVTYAPYVQNAERQQPFHRNSGWRTDREVAEEVAASDLIQRAFTAAIEAAWI